MRCRWFGLHIKEILRRMVPEAERICRAADRGNRKDRNPEPRTELSKIGKNAGMPYGAARQVRPALYPLTGVAIHDRDSERGKTLPYQLRLRGGGRRAARRSAQISGPGRRPGI